MMGRKYQVALLTATSILAFSPLEEAVAQDVVMRRPIPIAKTSGNAGWQTTPFVIVDATGNVIPESSACGNYQMKREVWCQDQDGKVTDPYFCSTKPKPNETQNQFFDAGCSYAWKTNDWSDPGNSCTFTEAQTRSVTCIRTLDGLAVSDSFCSEAKPETSREVVDLSSCTYSWKSSAFVDPGASCTEAEIQNRTVTCHRDLDDAQVDASECNAASKPSETQAVKDITGCSYSWQAGAFVDPGDSCTKNEVQTRTVVCTTSLDGSVVGDANCSPSAKPELTQVVEDYKSCEYTATQWSEWAFDSTCSASAIKTRMAKCQRSNDGGEIVADSECTSRGIDLTQTATEANYSTCTNNWVASEWADPGPACTASEIQMRSVTCNRDLDGALQPDAACNAATKPNMSQIVADYSSCTFSPANWSAWSYNSTCSASATRTRTAQCQRQDGTIVSDSACAAKGVILTQSEQVAIYDTCSYSWTTGAWVDPGSSCTSTEAQTRTVGCKRDLDGAVVANSLCNAATKPSENQTVTDFSGCTYSWSIGSWTDPGASCTANETQTRSISCKRSDGTFVADSNCAAPTPSSTQVVADYSGCTYSTSSTETACSNGSKTVSYTCTRSDGAGVAVSNCGLPSATSVQNCNSYAWSSGAWSAWGACVAPGTQSRTRNVVCQQTNGSTVTTVAESSCSTVGTKPSTTENQSCVYYTYDWSATAWSAYSSKCSTSATRTRTVTCNRSPDNVAVTDANCSSAGTKPVSSETTSVTSGCSYSWQLSAWNTGTAQCTASETQTRTATCLRSDGTTVSSSFCPTPAPATTQVVSDYSGCSFNWDTSAWTDPGASCTASETQTRSVTCLRSDGTVMADSSCNAATKPASTQTVADYSGCSYSWVSSAWVDPGASCTANETQTRTNSCRRSDGTTVANSLCTAPAPSTSQSVADYSGCTFSWVTGSWVDPGASCSANETQTRSVTCQRSDGSPAADSSCTTSKPATSQSVADYSGCTFTTSSTETSCTSGYKTLTYTCTRSDGTAAALSSCGLGSSTSTQACTSYAWNVGGWSGWGSCVAPGTQSRTRSVVCQATTGSSVTNTADGNCPAPKPTSSESQGCSYYSYSWVTGSWGNWSTGCGSATRNRAVWCYRNPDNQLMDPDQSQCTATAGTKPSSQESTYNIYSCGYTPSYGSWSTCSGGSQSRTMTSCQRSDGASVPTTDCVNAGYAATQSQGCSLTLVCGGWQSRSTCDGSNVVINPASNPTSGTYCEYTKPGTVMSGGGPQTGYTTGNPSIRYDGSLAILAQARMCSWQ